MKKLRNESGQATVEFVLVLPFILLLLFSVIDISILNHKKSEMAQVANAAATYAEIKVEPMTGQYNMLYSYVQSYVDTQFSSDKNKISKDVKVKYVEVTSDYVKVVLEQKANYLTALPGIITRSDSVTLEESSSIVFPSYSGPPYTKTS